jgi:uncharacterized protein YcgI (DUF1989 family)
MEEAIEKNGLLLLKNGIPQNQSENKQDKKNVKDCFCNACGCGSNTCKSKDARDDRDHKKNNGPS